jgi:hypothetical protein
MITLSLTFTGAIVAARPCGREVHSLMVADSDGRRNSAQEYMYCTCELPPLSPNNLGRSVTMTLDMQAVPCDPISTNPLWHPAQCRSYSMECLSPCLSCLIPKTLIYRFQGSLGTMVPNVWDYCESPHPFAACRFFGRCYYPIFFVQLAFGRCYIYIRIPEKTHTWRLLLISHPPNPSPPPSFGGASTWSTTTIQ